MTDIYMGALNLDDISWMINNFEIKWNYFNRIRFGYLPLITFNNHLAVL